MKRILTATVLVILALTLLMPATVLAAPAQAETFSANATITAITPGTVVPLGETGNWLVLDREIQGNIQGSINGSYVIDYNGIFALATQAGEFNGTFQSGPYKMRVSGETQPLVMVDVPGVPVQLPMLTITGEWNLIGGAKGSGEFSGWAIFVPDSEGHVLFIIASSMEITGKWYPKQ